MNLILAYSVSLLFVIFVSISGQYFTSKNVKTPWYDCIRSSITPPGWVFPIVWTILYILIAIALSRTLLLINDRTKIILLVLFTLNLLGNISWCYAFFYRKYTLLALFNLIFLILTGVLIIYLTPDTVTKYILIPYVIWLSFATILNSLAAMKKC